MSCCNCWLSGVAGILTMLHLCFTALLGAEAGGWGGGALSQRLLPAWMHLSPQVKTNTTTFQPARPAPLLLLLWLQQPRPGGNKLVISPFQILI